jgi:hypothetical protein
MELSLFFKNYPLSYFPQGGNGGFRVTEKLTPSPLGEGWKGGKDSNEFVTFVVNGFHSI